MSSPNHPPGRDPSVTPAVSASKLLRVPALWLSPISLAAVLMFFMTLFYIGAIVNPGGHLSGLPVALVNDDSGVSTQAGHVDYGAEMAADLLHSRQVTSRLSLKQLTSVQASTLMNSNRAYAAIEIPRGFSASLLSAYGLDPGSANPPTVQLLTNPRAGSIGVQLATAVAQPAVHQASLTIEDNLSSEAEKVHRTLSTQTNAVQPINVATSEFRALPPDSALGLSAFYISLLALMCGFLGAVLVNSSIDAALGYDSSEIGPKWRQRIPVAITRWQTLLTKWAVALAAVPILTGILLVVAIGLLHMNAPYPGELWLFTSFAGIAIAAGTLALFAAFGAIGQLLAMLLFVYLALASSGGTIPIQALPPFFRFTAGFEPLRQVLGGVRSILYFNARADAGLTRGMVLTAIGVVFWVLLGTAVTRWYDRRGMDRLSPDVLDFVQRSAQGYMAEAQLPGAVADPGRVTVTSAVTPGTDLADDQKPSATPAGGMPR